MEKKLKNIIELIAADFLDSVLALRYDICTCDLCKNDMLAYILSKVPARYVTTEKGSLRMIIEQTKAEEEALIGREILKAIEIVSKNPRHGLKEDKEGSFGLLLDKIYRDRGIDFRHYRRELLKRRTAVRMRANNLSSYSEYLMLLISKPEEYDKFFGALTINVSEFFRDQDVWDSFELILKKLIRNKKQNNDYLLRVWSAGCASGEETYSAAILLKELLKTEKQFSFKIWGTDIDQKCLKTAQSGEYSKEAIKNTSAQYLKTYFRFAAGHYQINKEIKDLVEFQNLDLIASPHLAKMDIILCRNVFIYFGRSLQEMLLTKFYKSLVKGGYLIMGKVEIILGEAKNIFREIDSNAKIYQKI